MSPDTGLQRVDLDSLPPSWKTSPDAHPMYITIYIMLYMVRPVYEYRSTVLMTLHCSKAVHLVGSTAVRMPEFLAALYRILNFRDSLDKQHAHGMGSVFDR